MPLALLRFALCQLLAVTFFFCTASAFAQDAASVRGELRDDFGRLVMDWGSVAPPAMAIELQPNQMVLRFDRPVRIDTAALRANLKAYFRDATLSGDSRSLLLGLKKPVTYRARTEGNRITLDVGQPGEAVFANENNSAAIPAAPAPATAELPPAVPSPLPPETTAAAETPPAGAPAVRVRTGEHDGYSRLAIDWPGVDFSISQDGRAVELVFDGVADIDLAALQRRQPKRLAEAVLRRDAAGKQVLALRVPDNVTAISFRNGDTIVLDLKDGAPPPATAPSVSAPDLVATAPAGAVAQPAAPVMASPGEPPPAQAGTPPAQAETPPAQAEVPAQQPTPPAGLATLGGDPLQPDLQSAPPVGDGAGDGAAPPVAQAPVPQIVTPVVITKEPAATPAAAPPAPVAISASAVPADNGAVLRFAFPQATALAAFRRGDAFWLVFARPGEVDPAALVRAAPILTGLARIDTPYGTVLRLPATGRLGGANMGADIIGDGRSWQISLGPGRNLRPATELGQRRETLGNGGTSLLFQVPEPGAAIALVDPEGGDRLAVIPVLEPGLGLATGADWPDFRVLGSFQGVAVIPVSDRARVESLPNGVVVTTVGDMSPPLMAETAPPPLDETTAPPGEAVVPQDATSPAAAPVEAVAPAGEVAGLFDLPAWRRGGEATYAADDAALRAAVEAAPPSQKPAANLALAQFRFAHGRNAEAVEALDQLRGTPLGGDPLAQTLRGAALALMGRDQDAAETLSDQRLAAIPEARLFRGYLAARARDWPAAADAFKAVLPKLDDYPKPARMTLRRAGAEALIVAGDPLTAQTFLDGMRLDSPNSEERAYHDYLSGRQQLRLGARDKAAEVWQGLAQSPVPEVRARSQFDLTEMLLEDGAIDARAAAANLEALRFVWRGDDFEFDLLNRLGQLYLASDQPRRGLTTLRQAATNFPTNPGAKSATDAMSQAFHDLYLGNRADRLPPLTAVALYDEFRELTPSGSEGDRMITALADRLVKVDLLDNAARLLENQVTKRLSGLDKARAGTRWAAVSLLNGQPGQALVAIQESEMPDMPPELMRERRRLQARALFETGDTLRGLALVRDDSSLDGLWLKADLQWRLREWPAAAVALDDLVRAEAARLRLALPSEPTAEDLADDPATALTDPGDAEAIAAQRDNSFNEVLAPLILNQATALSLANDRAGLRRLARLHGQQMAKGPYATAFATLTSPRTNLADSITAAMESVDQLGAFVEDYRARLRASSLSAPGEPAL
ncbi:hypothetical protein [Dongia mobilis]|nr:hypothetical protein [Dongia mobilis]